MRCAKAPPRLAVEVLVEEDVVAEVRIPLQTLAVAVQRLLPSSFRRNSRERQRVSSAATWFIGIAGALPPLVERLGALGPSQRSPCTGGLGGGRGSYH
jgi:hypothetical protein